MAGRVFSLPKPEKWRFAARRHRIITYARADDRSLPGTPSPRHRAFSRSRRPCRFRGAPALAACLHHAGRKVRHMRGMCQHAGPMPLRHEPRLHKAPHLSRPPPPPPPTPSRSRDHRRYMRLCTVLHDRDGTPSSLARAPCSMSVLRQPHVESPFPADTCLRARKCHRCVLPAYVDNPTRPPTDEDSTASVTSNLPTECRFSAC